MGMGTGMGMVEGSVREMGMVVWRKFPLVALIIFLALYFSTGNRSLHNLLFLHSNLAWFDCFVAH